MEAVEQARELIQALGNNMGVGAIDFDAEGTVAFEVDSTLTLVIGIEPELDVITLYGPIHGSDRKRRSELLETMLTSNFMWQATQGATLALDAATNHLVLHQRLPLAQLAYDDFEKKTETFINTLQDFTRLVAEDPAEAASGIETSASFTEPMFGALRA